MPDQNLTLAFDGAVATLTLARPEKLNPIDWSTVKELRAAVARIGAHKGVRIAIVTGAGRAFSAGGDLTRYIELFKSPAETQGFLDAFNDLLREIERSPVIYLAAVNGACVAGGLELMLACDLAVAAHEAKIGCGHVNFGVLPGAGGSQRLPRAIGTFRAKHFMLTGRLVDGREAERIGLVNEAVPLNQLMDAARTLASTMAEKSPAGLRTMKRLVNAGIEMPLETALRFEIDTVHAYLTTHPDAMEGLVAFRDKRRPQFRPE